MTSTTPRPPSVPLPPPEDASHEKQPGHTRQDLIKMTNGAKAQAIANGATPTPLPASSSSTSTPTPTSMPPTSKPILATNGAGSSSTPTPTATLIPPPNPITPAVGPGPANGLAPLQKVKRAVSASAPSTPAIPSRAPSVASQASDFHKSEKWDKSEKGDREKDKSEKGEKEKDKHKFTLKDLLASAGGPKLSRRSSARSNATASSRHSLDSDHESDGRSVSRQSQHSQKGGYQSGGEGKERGYTSGGEGGSKVGRSRSVKSAGGDSVGSLSKKYGVCQKIAIGKGATSVVRLAHKWDRSEGLDKLYAVKEFRKRRKNETEKEYVKKLTAEFCISSTLHHTNIVETVDLVQDEQGRWCEVMEFCPGGDLYAAIKKGGMSPSEVECCFKQILLGVGYLHSQGVAHRDIKPENLFFDTLGHLKIGDYGASTVYRLPWEATIHMSTGLCGSEPYIAPEQFLGKPYDARLVDIWACGIVYYCLHFQELPWRAAQQSDQLYAAYAAAAAAAPPPPLAAAPLPPSSTNNSTVAIASGTETPAPPPPIMKVDRDRNHTNSHLVFPPTISNLSPRACRPLIRKMLEPDPKMRSDIEEVLGCAWMQEVEVCWKVGEKARHVHVNARAMATQTLGADRER